ncbi:fimbrial protein [Enterobacter mori]|uniref:fimbrial protein n=1 Tax=Enterobacter mori TaxID=539813 RepID=UPI003B83D949
MAKRYILGLSAASLLVMSSLASATDGTVNFTGTVINAPCSIATESVDQTIDFGALSSVFLDGDNVSEMKPLTIKLIACDASVTSASITFAGQSVTGATDELATAGTTGTAIQITNAGTPVTFGTPVTLGTITEGDNTLQFGATVKKATGVTATTAGDFTAVTNFTMVYP